MDPLPPIEMRYLRYFVAVAEDLNYRRAAQRVHVSAPALSVRIKHLEDLLGVRLFERDTTFVRLTVAGENLLHESRKLFHHMADLVASTREAARGNRGRLCIGMPGFFSHSFMPEVLNRYRGRFPEVEVSLLDLTVNDEQSEALETGHIQVGFLYGFNPPHLKNVDSLMVMDMPMCAVMGVHHPLVQQKQVTLADLAACQLLAIRRFEPQTRNLISVFNRENLHPKDIKQANSFNVCVAMLVSGDGVAMLPKMRVMVQNPELVLRPIKEPASGLRMQVHAVWKKNATSPHIMNFVEALREAGVHHD